MKETLVPCQKEGRCAACIDFAEKVKKSVMDSPTSSAFLRKLADELHQQSKELVLAEEAADRALSSTNSDSYYKMVQEFRCCLYRVSFLAANMRSTAEAMQRQLQKQSEEGR